MKIARRRRRPLIVARAPLRRSLSAVRGPADEVLGGSSRCAAGNMDVDRFRAYWTPGPAGRAAGNRRAAAVLSRRQGWCRRDVSVPLDFLKTPGAPTLDDYLTSVAAPADAVPES